MSGQAPISQVTRTKKEAKAGYNLLSSWYDLLAGPSEREYIGRVKKQVPVLARSETGQSEKLFFDKSIVENTRDVAG